MENDVNDLENLTELASSTILNSVPARQSRPVLSTVFEAPVLASIEECSINLSMSDLATVSYITTPPQSTTIEPFVTQPPPYVPTQSLAPRSSPPPLSPHPRQDRGRARRRRGRPRLNSICPHHHPHQVHSGVEDEQGVYLLHYHPLQGGEEGAQGSVKGHMNLS